jgi:hypothetical protein
MIKRCVPAAFLLWIILPSAFPVEGPTVSVDHMYYLQARADYVERLNQPQMMSYCVSQKIGGKAFEDLYGQVLALRVEVAKMIKVDQISYKDPKVEKLNLTITTYTDLLYEEAQKAQQGIIIEGKVASQALSHITKQNNPP